MHQATEMPRSPGRLIPAAHMHPSERSKRFPLKQRTCSEFFRCMMEEGKTGLPRMLKETFFLCDGRMI